MNWLLTEEEINQIPLANPELVAKAQAQKIVGLAERIGWFTTTEGNRCIVIMEREACQLREEVKDE